MENKLIGKRAKIKNHAQGYVKALWGALGTIEYRPNRLVLVFDAPVDVGGCIYMELVTLNDDSFDVID